MIIAFYVDEMNLRGVANSTYDYAYYNKKILKNTSVIFYNKKNFRNNNKVILKFKKKFKTFPIKSFQEIDSYKEKLKIDFIYTQKSGEKDKWISEKIKTLVHFVYPQKLSEYHGHRYVCVSKWLSKKFSNNKIPYLPYIVKNHETKINLKKNLKIKDNQIVFGCYGGDSSFDLKFTHDAIQEIVKKRKDIVFIFMNINKFCNNPQILFLKGTTDKAYKRKFINTCDAMIYGRSLGESFGLACGEFACLNKKIISYKYNRHRSHIQSLPINMSNEYSSKKNLIKILNQFKKTQVIKYKKKENQYLKLNPTFVMKKFKKVFLNETIPMRINYIDKINNYLGYIEMGYYYIRHKIYEKYYLLLESKLSFKKD